MFPMGWAAVSEHRAELEIKCWYIQEPKSSGDFTVTWPELETSILQHPWDRS